MKFSFTIPRRYYISLLSFVGFCIIYGMRVNLSIAILEMTKTQTFHIHNKTVVKMLGPFADWSRVTEGAVLSSFFYGYIVTQIPGGWLSNRYGGKYVLGCGVLGCAVATLFSPLAKNAGTLIFLRIVQGLFQGVSYPSMHAIWSRWAPPDERTRLATTSFSGAYFGTVIAQPLAGLLAENYGYKSVFIFFGVIGVLWATIWMVTVSDDPSKDRWISSSEMKEIQDAVGYSHEQVSHLKPPWKEIFLSGPVWAITVAHFAENWGFYTMLTRLPQFLMDLEHSLPLRRASIIAAVPYLVMAIALQAGGWIADYLRSKRQISTVVVRKGFNGAAFGFQALFIVCAGYCRTPAAVITLISLSVGFGGFAWSGFSVNHLDIAPQFASVLMGVSNTFATIPGMLAPLIAGKMVPTGKMSEWEGVWWLSAAMFIAGAAVYISLASGTRQPWANLPEGYQPHEDEKETGEMD